MNDEKEIAKKIIENIRRMFAWVPGHHVMEFGDCSVSYYDTPIKDDFFMLKYEGVEYTSSNLGHTLELPNKLYFDYFCLRNWLDKLLKITTITQEKTIEKTVELNKITINGVNYERVED